MGQELKQRVEYLVRDLKAYEDYDYGPKGLRHAVKTELYLWKKKQRDMTVVQVPQLYRDLWKQADRKTKSQQLEEALESDWSTFPTYSSNGKHLKIEDKHGYLLIYRLPIPTQHTETLEATAHLIPSSSAREHRRGQTSEKYWGLWRKYKMEPHMSGEYYRDLPSSQRWLDANQPYFRHMSNILRLLDPQMYVRYTSINRFLPEGLELSCRIWYACGILRNMAGKGTPHKDPSDYHCGLNVNTAWGDFTMARIVFWELKITVEVQKEEAIFFMPRILTHNAVDIQGGARNVVDAFVHENVLSWKDRQHEKATGYLRGGPKRKRRKLGLEELKARTTREPSSAGAGKALEHAQDEGDSETEREMEALYHRGALEEIREEEDED
ncbi:hypothetical protein GP486_006864 [Trichoglossum hirsutum]|uniref:Uncharacterized protein n=1 Tax=Trichoglossum hirsutum TaxID=265104 RepID=A0A9P8IJV2_9PEZI|nr:hypothetical protein GP486_006864 [Trichoglossum hirsutum]